jgi:cold shock CspA family protein
MNGTFRKMKDGFGFIAGEDGIDYFFHWQGLSKFTKQFRYCQENEKVTFEVEVTERGPRAVNVKVDGYTILVPPSLAASGTTHVPITKNNSGTQIV